MPLRRVSEAPPPKILSKQTGPIFLRNLYLKQMWILLWYPNLSSCECSWASSRAIFIGQGQSKFLFETRRQQIHDFLELWQDGFIVLQQQRCSEIFSDLEKTHLRTCRNSFVCCSFRKLVGTVCRPLVGIFVRSLLFVFRSTCRISCFVYRDCGCATSKNKNWEAAAAVLVSDKGTWRIKNKVKHETSPRNHTDRFSESASFNLLLNSQQRCWPFPCYRLLFKSWPRDLPKQKPRPDFAQARWQDFVGK